MTIDFSALYNTPGAGRQTTPAGGVASANQIQPLSMSPTQNTMSPLSMAVPMNTTAYQQAGAQPAASDPSQYGNFNIQDWLNGQVGHVLGDNATDPGALGRLLTGLGMTGWGQGQSMLGPLDASLADYFRTGQLPAALQANITSQARGQEAAGRQGIEEASAPGGAQMRALSNLEDATTSGIARVPGDMWGQMAQLAQQGGQFQEGLAMSAIIPFLQGRFGERIAKKQAKGGGGGLLGSLF